MPEMENLLITDSHIAQIMSGLVDKSVLTADFDGRGNGNEYLGGKLRLRAPHPNHSGRLECPFCRLRLWTIRAPKPAS